MKRTLAVILLVIVAMGVMGTVPTRTKASTVECWDATHSLWLNPGKNIACLRSLIMEANDINWGD